MSRRIAVTSIAAVVIAAGMGMSLASVHPAGTGAPIVVGSASNYWEPQSGLECAIYASRAVIGARTGQVVTVGELETAAGSAYTPDGGTVMSAVPALLGQYGVKASLVWSDVTRIRTALAHGQSVIGLVNGPTLWVAEDNGNDFEATPAQFAEGVDHAVVLQSIVGDVVTVVDSSADHRTETVTVAQLADAMGAHGMAIVAG